MKTDLITVGLMLTMVPDQRGRWLVRGNLHFYSFRMEVSNLNRIIEMEGVVKK